MLLNILLVILVIDCIALTGVILLQRSEGGALGMGSGPSGIFTARGAGDLLTRTTAVLTFFFFFLSLVITLLAGHGRATSSVTERLKVNPIDLNALARQSSAPAASSSAPAAPPLPNAVPPLPNAAPPLPTTAPAPTATRRAPPATTVVPNITLPAPRPVQLPRPNLNAPPPAPPASGAPAGGQ